LDPARRSGPSDGSPDDSPRSGELLPIGAILPDVLQRYQLQLP
jgi:hypothetical protein